jgi:hypothetical protein
MEDTARLVAFTADVQRVVNEYAADDSIGNYKAMQARIRRLQVAAVTVIRHRRFVSNMKGVSYCKVTYRRYGKDQGDDKASREIGSRVVYRTRLRLPPRARAGLVETRRR